MIKIPHKNIFTIKANYPCNMQPPLPSLLLPPPPCPLPGDPLPLPAGIPAITFAGVFAGVVAAIIPVARIIAHIITSACWKKRRLGRWRVAFELASTR
jgi:hypothetical protein